jgi:glycolate oxidase iron-sulfur subunit
MKTEFAPELLGDPHNAASEAEIRRCVRCGFCTATCPTYVLLGDELDSPRGRIYLIKEMLETQAEPSAEVITHIDRCLSCLACKTTCPSGVDYRKLIDHARAYVEQRGRRPMLDRLQRALLAFVLPRPWRFRVALSLARLARPMADLFRGTPALKPLAAMLDLAPARRPPRAAHVVSSKLAQVRGRIILLGGCAEPVLRPQIQASARRLFARMGLEVVGAPGEACCGALVHHLGREEAAKAAARVNVDAWSRIIEAGGVDAIVSTAAGCGTSLKAYGELLADDPRYAEKSARVSALARDFIEVVDAFGLPLADKAPPLTVAYQAACSLQHGQGVRDAPVRLLSEAGFVVRQPTEAHLCCGSAGTYNILEPDLSRQLRDRKLERLSRLDADLTATANIGCLTQLASGGAMPVVHVAELLDWAAGGPAPEGVPAVNQRAR